MKKEYSCNCQFGLPSVCSEKGAENMKIFSESNMKKVKWAGLLASDDLYVIFYSHGMYYVMNVGYNLECHIEFNDSDIEEYTEVQLMKWAKSQAVTLIDIVSKDFMELEPYDKIHVNGNAVIREIEPGRYEGKIKTYDVPSDRCPIVKKADIELNMQKLINRVGR